VRALVLVMVALAAGAAAANAAVSTPDSVLMGFNVPSRSPSLT